MFPVSFARTWTGASKRKSWPIAQAHVAVAFLLGRLLEQSPSLFPAQWQEDSKSAFLMASTRGRLLVLGVDPFAEVRCTGFADGDCLWDLSLQRTGDDKLEGDVFGEGVDLFSWGGGGGEEQLQGACC
jgi:hypothetical protein